MDLCGVGVSEFHFQAGDTLGLFNCILVHEIITVYVNPLFFFSNIYIYWSFSKKIYIYIHIGPCRVLDVWRILDINSIPS